MIQEEDSSWNEEDAVVYYKSSLTTTDMLWQDSAVAANEFVGFVKLQ